MAKDGAQLRTYMFAHLPSRYLLDDHFDRLGKGNDRGRAEGLVSDVRRKLMGPLAVADSFDALNAG